MDEADESLIRDFLLGRTPEAERDRIEERLLAEPDFSELVSAIEEELIDDYTAGLLFEDERQRFESFFLVTEERRRRLRFSVALGGVKLRDVRGAPPDMEAPREGTGNARGTWMHYAAAAVAMVSLGSALWMANSARVSREGLRAAEEQISSLAKERQVLAEDYERRIAEAERRASTVTTTTPGPVAFLRRSETADEPPVVVAALTPGVLRDAGAAVPSVRVGPATLLVELRLELAEDSHPRYAASVHDASGIELLRVDGLKSRTRGGRVVVVVQVPAAQLSPNDYSIRIWGDSQDELSELDRYYVRILLRSGRSSP